MVESSQERAKRNKYRRKKQCSKKYTKKPALLFVCYGSTGSFSRKNRMD